MTGKHNSELSEESGASTSALPQLEIRQAREARWARGLTKA